MKKFRNIMICILVLTATVIILGCTVYNYKISPVSDSKEEIEVIIPSGSSMRQIATLLEEKGLIRDDQFFLIYAKLFQVNNIKASTYQLAPNMGVANIIKVLEKGNSYNPDSISITFKEGINMRKLAGLIAEKTELTQEEILAKSNEEAYLDTLIEKYWFLTDEIKNPNIYYKLEGYLFPETYQFYNKNVTVEDVFEKMLDQMDKVLTPYREAFEKQEKSVHEILTMASIVELEGINDENRPLIAGVFYHRLDIKMNLGSDVTTYYAAGIDMSDRDLTKAELDDVNAYNTRTSSMAGKLPVGPICLPSENSIQASIEPVETDYLYFVADKYKNVYFTKTYQEHLAKVKEIKDKGDWITW